jgi:hypothetical protein
MTNAGAGININITITITNNSIRTMTGWVIAIARL